jgi:hypothetical protein
MLRLFLSRVKIEKKAAKLMDAVISLLGCNGLP